MDTSLILMIFILLLLIANIVLLLRSIKITSIYKKNFKPHISNQKLYYMDDFYDEAYSYITKIEIDLRIRLSKEAKQLLILPLMEVQKINQSRKGKFSIRGDRYYEFESWQDSLATLMESIKSEPARIDRFKDTPKYSNRSSLSVIKAFSKKFCNIPPFCGER